MIQCPRCQRKVQGLCVNDGYTPNEEFSRPDFEVCADCKPYCEAIVSKKLPEAPVVLITASNTPEDRFWLRVIQHHYTKCWSWEGARGGRKRRPVMRNGKKITDAARYSYELRYGPLPANLKLSRRCCKPDCLNPEHLLATIVPKMISK